MSLFFRLEHNKLGSVHSESGNGRRPRLSWSGESIPGGDHARFQVLTSRHAVHPGPFDMQWLGGVWDDPSTPASSLRRGGECETRERWSDDLKLLPLMVRDRDWPPHCLLRPSLPLDSLSVNIQQIIVLVRKESERINRRKMRKMLRKENKNRADLWGRGGNSKQLSCRISSWRTPQKHFHARKKQTNRNKPTNK